jgi:hypothetical protein
MEQESQKSRFGNQTAPIAVILKGNRIKKNWRWLEKVHVAHGYRKHTIRRFVAHDPADVKQDDEPARSPACIYGPAIICLSMGYQNTSAFRAIATQTPYPGKKSTSTVVRCHPGIALSISQSLVRPSVRECI